jgi:hypothetical protein
MKKTILKQRIDGDEFEAARDGGKLTRRSRTSASQEAGAPMSLKGFRRKPLYFTAFYNLLHVFTAFYTPKKIFHMKQDIKKMQGGSEDVLEKRAEAQADPDGYQAECKLTPEERRQRIKEIYGLA